MAGKLADADKVLYLYALTQSGPADLSPIGGVEETAPIETLRCGNLVAWLSRVPRDEFAENLVQNMENLDWLSEKSVAHQRVIAAISEVADVLPARFGTVFITEDSLKADIASRRTEIISDFDRTAGSDEWGVKVFALAPKFSAPASGKVSGKDYLRVKSQLLKNKGPAKPDEEVERFNSELQKLAADVAEPGKVSGGGRNIVYNVSLLIKRQKRKQFEKLLQQFSKRWEDEKAIECTGPWPPYSFVSRRA
jgi:hypothetical protein